MNETGFDRLRPRASESVTAPVGPSDPQGARSLYSVADQAPSLGAVTVDCSRCDRTSVITPRRLLGLAAVSVHLPLVKRGHPSWMQCPSCGHRTWVRLGVRL
jgi:hypothetical protein